MVDGFRNLCVNQVTGVQRCIKFQFADDVTKRGCGQVFNCCQRTFYTIGKLYRIGNLEENNGINLHGNIIFRNNWLRLKVYNLFLDGNSLCNPIQKRTQEVYTGFPCSIKFSQPFYNIDVRLRNNLDSSKEDNQNKDN